MKKILLLLLFFLPISLLADDTYNATNGILTIHNIKVDGDHFAVELLHQGDLVFDVISSTPASSTTTIDTYNAETGAVSLLRVAVGDETFAVEMQRQSELLFKVISATKLTSEARLFKLEVWADNWFAAYSDTSLIVEDSVSITTERSFNAETANFTASYPISLNVIMKDFKENDTGLEYIGERNQQMGDGGYIAQITDMTTNNIVAVSNSDWKCKILHEAPLDKSCEQESNPNAGVAPCTFNRVDEPDDWKSNAYDDSEWISATEHTVADVSPKDGYDEIKWDANAQLIWGSDLETHNTLICRITIEQP